MPFRFLVWSSLLWAATLGAAPRSVPFWSQLPGVKTDGSILLPNQWSLRPSGRQVALGDFPVNLAVHPSGKFVVALHSGFGSHELVSIHLPDGKVIARAQLPETFYGVAFSPDGRRIYASGAGAEVIHEFEFDSGNFGHRQEIPLREPSSRGVPSGLAVSSDGGRIYSANVYGQDVVVADLSSRLPVSGFPLRPGMPVTDLSQTRVSPEPALAAAEKRAAAKLDELPPDAPFPYACVLDEVHHRLYVSLWGTAAVAVLDSNSGRILDRWETGEHPCEMVLSRNQRWLYVANASRNSVTVLDTQSGKAVETLSSAMQPGDPPGSTPNSLALSPDERQLFIANAGNNNLAVFDVSTPGRSRPMGFIPVGWYPTSVRVTPDGRHLLVANGKGISSKANRHGSQPGRELPESVIEYIGGLMQGTLSIIPIPEKPEVWTAKLKDYSERALRCTPSNTGPVAQSGHSPNPIPSKVGGRSPIRYVIYVVKENRTYDQVLGDMPEGNGDPSLCLFDETITPNHHALAREFVLLDNFYVDGEVSADGHEWTAAAYATDFVEKTWPLSYGHNGRGKYPYPSEGSFPVAYPSSGYIWDKAIQAGLSYRSYGEFCDAGKKPGDPVSTRLPVLQGRFDPNFQPWDLDYPDVKRAEHFAAEIKRFEKAGDMPRLQIVRLPNDHTYGTSSGRLTPRAMMADNDLAFGKFVEAISHSKFWSQTAIFVVEDDAQNGPDHVDAHRSIAFAISPYIRRHTRDSTMYSTCSMLHTMELILGLSPMTQFDAAAAPLYASFQPKADLKPFSARPVTVNLSETNSIAAYGREESDEMDFSKEDAVDDLRLNEVIWRSVKGSDQPMPRPVRAAFVTAGGDPDDR
jgi:DNA-binding beta-propeller fold protein YncE